MGRFMSPDKPFADQHSGAPQSWNLYSYTRNNPLRFIDDDGEEVKETTKTVYYTVQGSTAAEAWNNAPAEAAKNGVPGGFPGDTKTSTGIADDYHFDVSTQKNGSTTTVTDTVTSADVNLSVTTTLPKWSGYSGASADEQKQWDQLSGGLSDHEDGHKTIAEKATDALDKALPGTTATGTGTSAKNARANADDSLQQNLQQKQQQAVSDAQKEQDDYDKRTDHGTKPDPKKQPKQN
jgi:predicted secreted Zn-dependent protease